MDPDETRYAQISQEMLLSGNWVTPHFMGIRYFEKPAGGYWLIALGQAVFGQNLFGVRIASALTTGLSVLLAYLIARRMWNDPRKSFACALLYLSFGLVAGQAGIPTSIRNSPCGSTSAWWPCGSPSTPPPRATV
jgi:4-amino-4-deoxy-L-arabinose transferase